MHARLPCIAVTICAILVGPKLDFYISSALFTKLFGSEQEKK